MRWKLIVRKRKVSPSGFSFTEAGFGIAASAADILPRIDQLIAGERVDALGDRTLSLHKGHDLDDFFLNGYWVVPPLSVVNDGDGYF